MGLRDRLRRLQRRAEGPIVSIPQQDGTVKRFPERDLASAYLDAVDRSTGRSAPKDPEHPICAAARNSSDPQWRDNLFVTEWQEPVEDLSE